MGYHINDFLAGSSAYRLIPATRAATPEILELLSQSAKADGTSTVPSDSVRGMLASFGASLPDYCRIARDHDGYLVGVLVLFPPSGEADSSQILWEVDPSVRDEGIGAALLDWSRVRAEELAPRPAGVRSSFAESQTWRLPVLFEQGFTRLGRSWRMEGPAVLPSAAHPSPAIQIVPWTEARTTETLDAFLEAFAEHPRLQETPGSSWKAKLIDVPQFRPDLSWLALEENRVIGFALNWAQSASVGWIEAFGVLPRTRGRGIGRALLERSIEEFGSNGFRRVGLDVDPDASPSAVRLYEAFGLTTVKRTETVLYRLAGPLA